ncbi:MAG: M48 family metallopeptidase [Defluviitaleaceae bacterium]|nr:M48 family metallopeptidase [Defluviitaleaceae bacterium]MCL2274224.1 M48 family metallopeptidase [Defluviitaleaceae bacterium]
MDDNSIDDYLIGQIIYSIQESPDDAQYKYAQRMYVRTFHEEERDIVDVEIRDDERIELYVPMSFESEYDLKPFMDENGDAILAERNRRLNEKIEGVSQHESLAYNSKLPFLGEYLPICTIDAGSKHESFVQNGAIHMRSGLSDTEIRAELLKLCRNTAYDYLKLKVDHFAKIMGVSYSNLKIDDGRRTWGLFNDVNKSIILSRRLMMMSESIINLLVVHELAHGLEFYHGHHHNFEMEKILPNYEARDEAFHETCETLLAQGWI